MKKITIINGPNLNLLGNGSLAFMAVKASNLIWKN
jgi:3-dehydroquinate dehydratase